MYRCRKFKRLTASSISPLSGTLLLEARVSEKPLSLPPFLEIEREVTGLPDYDSYYISLVTPPTL